jgi:hypothetical protein
MTSATEKIKHIYTYDTYPKNDDTSELVNVIAKRKRDADKVMRMRYGKKFSYRCSEVEYDEDRSQLPWKKY